MGEIWWTLILMFILVLFASFAIEFIFGLNIIITLLAMLVVGVIMLNATVYGALTKEEDNNTDSEVSTK